MLKIRMCIVVLGIFVLGLPCAAQTDLESFWGSHMSDMTRAISDPTINSRVRNIWFKLARYSGQAFPVVPAQQFTMGQALPNGVILLDLIAAGDDSPEVTAFWLSHEYGHQVMGHPRLSMTPVGRWMIARGGTSQEDAADRWAGRFLRSADYRIEPVLATLCSLPNGPAGDTHSTGKQRAAIVARAYGRSNTDDVCDAPDPDPDPEKYSPRIRMWTTSEGSPASFDLVVDTETVGTLNNMNGPVRLDLDNLEAGRHSFTMSNITVYGMVPTPYGPRLSVIATGLECSGTFRVRDSSGLSIAARLTPNGEVTCQIR